MNIKNIKRNMQVEVIVATGHPSRYKGTVKHIRPKRFLSIGVNVSGKTRWCHPNEILKKEINL